jgi:hypothetical protein
MAATNYGRLCPDLTCSRPLRFSDGCARCDRCGLILMLPSPQTTALLAAHRRADAIDAVRDPLVHEGFRDWLSNVAYWDGGGYRLKTDRRRRARWSKAVMKRFPHCDDFHEAAHLFTPQGEYKD